MAKKDRNRPQNNAENSENKKKRKTRMDRIRENKPLFGLVVLVGLIILAAIGVGAYYAIDSLTSNNDSETVEESNNEDADASNSEDSNNSSQDSENSEDSQNTSDENNNSDDSGSSDSSDNDSGNTSSDSDSSNNGEAQATGHSAGGLAKSLAVGEEIARTGVWRATDYIFGDIVSSDYTVQSGDTLWEIADGYYGDGFKWVVIKDNNSGAIDVLPNGEEALIYPGTQLTLPE
ncbi:LysM peptidoglycan-binding domain-containing protein [Candidatus Dojkabacteria bacterium]|uniref:LysM peptidoglycan-binding domain-containing protein n=1 Tax=Candidatus Dojkabacteria bacterium TaxID=2099670 RepID=A0A955I993_9BACT|nr:LysM peptidoglycan-binding domain-containing protein [Candidatus Dojkabacteria bacterium]